MRNAYCSLRIVLGLVAIVSSFSETLLWGQVKNDFAQQKAKLINEVLVPGGIKDPRVLKAISDTPRHEFVAEKYRSEAYYDKALPIGDQQTISSPLIVSFMTQALDPQETDKVLEIGTGSGYQAAVLSPLVKDVYSIEIVEPLGKATAKLLKRLAYKNVHTKIGDGFQGWAEHAPFDKIIVTCSPEKVPQPLIDQLREGGLIVVPIGERYSQTLVLLRKVDGKIEEEKLLPTLFVPMTGKAEAGREVKPDPANPKFANGSFEEEAFESGAQPGWYYERQVKWVKDPKSPDGDHHVLFSNEDSGVSSHLLQGFGIDGRKVKRVELSGWIQLKNVVANGRTEQPYIIVTLYDSNRRELDPLVIGPFNSDSDWHEVKKTFDIPVSAREGIVRIGLFGATGEARFDNIKIQKVTGK